MPAHTQFMLMNTARGGTSGLDSYDEYTGVVLEALLANAGILSDATAITAISADAWTQFHPLDPTDEPGMYPSMVPTPRRPFITTLWRTPPPIPVSGGWITAPRPPRGAATVTPSWCPAVCGPFWHTPTTASTWIPGVLDADNRLQGEGPLRVVVPQKDARPAGPAIHEQQ
jgi:hypothetical protein